MNELMAPGGEHSIEAVLSYAALGLIVGFGYYMGERLPMIGNAPPPKGLIITVMVLRVLAAVAFFAYLASLGGVLPILSAFAGFLVGRVIAFRARGDDA